MASTVAAHIYELIELLGVLYIRYRMEGGTVVGPLFQVDEVLADYPVLVYGTLFKDLNDIRANGLRAYQRSPIVFMTSVPEEKQPAPLCNGPAQILIEMDVERMVKKGLTFFVDGNKNIVTSGNHDGRIPVTFFKKCYNPKNGAVMITDEDIAAQRKVEDAEEAELLKQK